MAIIVVYYNLTKKHGLQKSLGGGDSGAYSPWLMDYLCVSEFNSVIFKKIMYMHIFTFLKKIRFFTITTCGLSSVCVLRCFFKLLLSTKSLQQMLTCMASFQCVLFMISKISIPWKCFITLVTFVWFLLSASSCVTY